MSRRKIHRGSASVLTGEAAIAKRLGLGRSAAKRVIEAGGLITYRKDGCTVASAASVESYLADQHQLAERQAADDLARWADDGGTNPVRL